MCSGVRRGVCVFGSLVSQCVYVCVCVSIGSDEELALDFRFLLRLLFFFYILSLLILCNCEIPSGSPCVEIVLSHEAQGDYLFCSFLLFFFFFSFIDLIDLNYCACFFVVLFSPDVLTTEVLTTVH